MYNAELERLYKEREALNSAEAYEDAHMTSKQINEALERVNNEINDLETEIQYEKWLSETIFYRVCDSSNNIITEFNSYDDLTDMSDMMDGSRGFELSSYLDGLRQAIEKQEDVSCKLYVYKYYPEEDSEKNTTIEFSAENYFDKAKDKMEFYHEAAKRAEAMKKAENHHDDREVPF